MYTLRTLLVLGVSAFALAAPPTDKADECSPPKGKRIELAACCKIPLIIENEIKFMNECVDLVRDKLTNRTGPPPKPEGFDCLEECILSKMGLLGEGKKFDTAKLAATMKDSYSGDWAPIKEVVMKKCEYAIKQTAPCEGYSIESLLKCFLRETYKNCPASLLTASDLCKDNKERMERCPSASPFCPIAGVDD